MRVNSITVFLAPQQSYNTLFFLVKRLIECLTTTNCLLCLLGYCLLTFFFFPFFPRDDDWRKNRWGLVKQEEGGGRIRTPRERQRRGGAKHLLLAGARVRHKYGKHCAWCELFFSYCCLAWHEHILVLLLLQVERKKMKKKVEGEETVRFSFSNNNRKRIEVALEP